MTVDLDELERLWDERGRGLSRPFDAFTDFGGDELSSLAVSLHSNLTELIRLARIGKEREHWFDGYCDGNCPPDSSGYAQHDSVLICWACRKTVEP